LEQHTPFSFSILGVAGVLDIVVAAVLDFVQ
jgi:hypothetical protein